MRGNCSIFQALLIIPINQPSNSCPSLTERIKLLKETNILYGRRMYKRGKSCKLKLRRIKRGILFQARHLFHCDKRINLTSNYQLRGRNGGLRRYLGTENVRIKLRFSGLKLSPGSQGEHSLFA